MPQEVIDRVNKLGEADGKSSLFNFYDRHGNPAGDTKNPNAYLTDAPEEDTEEDETVPDITGVDQDPPDNKQQDQETPDNNQNEHGIKYGTKEVGDRIEDEFQNNDDLQPQEK